MANLYISEFEGRTQGHAGNISEALPLPPVAQQTVAIGAGSVLSNALGGATRYVRVIADAVCSIDVGTAPVATATKLRLAANVPEVFSVTPGHKIAVITNT